MLSLFERGNSLEATRHRRKFPFVKGVPSIRSGHSPPLYKISIRGLRGKISAPASAQPSRCDLESKVAKHTRTTSAAAPASQIHITARLRSSNRQFHLKRLIYESRHGGEKPRRKTGGDWSGGWKWRGKGNRVGVDMLRHELIDKTLLILLSSHALIRQQQVANPTHALLHSQQ